MIRKPTGYDSAPAYGNGEFESVTPGGHICRIRAAHEVQRSNGRALAIAFDLDQMDIQAGYYTRAHERRLLTDPHARFPGVYTQAMDGKSTPFFKGLITAIQESNPGYTWNWDENSLKGKLFGGVFRREEYMGNDGRPHWACKCVQVRNVQGITDIPAPEDKPLSAPANAGDAGFAGSSTGGMAGYTPVDNDDRLPF